LVPCLFEKTYEKINETGKKQQTPHLKRNLHCMKQRMVIFEIEKLRVYIFHCYNTCTLIYEVKVGRYCCHEPGGWLFVAFSGRVEEVLFRVYPLQQFGIPALPHPFGNWSTRWETMLI